MKPALYISEDYPQNHPNFSHCFKSRPKSLRWFCGCHCVNMLDENGSTRSSIECIEKAITTRKRENIATKTPNMCISFATMTAKVFSLHS